MSADLLATATLTSTTPNGEAFYRLPDGRRVWIMRNGTFIQGHEFGPWVPLADLEPTQDTLPMDAS